MNIKIDSLLDGARRARGTVVIVDVFRAFTTAAVALPTSKRNPGWSQILPYLSAQQGYPTTSPRWIQGPSRVH